MTERFTKERLAPVWEMLNGWAREKRCTAIGAAVGDARGVAAERFFGSRKVNAAEKDASAEPWIFLIASPTKPIVATAFMKLVEQGTVRLTDPVCDYLPEFAPEERGITPAHCLTHTSGLPDMLPENAELRAAEAPLSKFYARLCELKPDFLPGTNVQYQSMGFLALQMVLEKVTGEKLPKFMKERFFEPLKMHDTSLGMPPEWEAPSSHKGPRQERIAEIRLMDDPSGHSSCWNKTYWRRLGAPWGGLLATPGDLGRWCSHLLGIHQGRDWLISRATLAAMTGNQLTSFPHVPEANRRCFGWGYGWQMHWPNHAGGFGDLLSNQAYGHWGATGTMVWIDPARDLFCVLLTTEPMKNSQSLLPRFSNGLCAAVG